MTCFPLLAQQFLFWKLNLKHLPYIAWLINSVGVWTMNIKAFVFFTYMYMYLNPQNNFGSITSSERTCTYWKQLALQILQSLWSNPCQCSPSTIPPCSPPTPHLLQVFLWRRSGCRKTSQSALQASRTGDFSRHFFTGIPPFSPFHSAQCRY